MDNNLKAKLTATDKWLRALFMILFICIGWLVRMLICLIAIFQFLASLFDKPNTKLQELGEGLSNYGFQIMLYLTYNTEMKPFPFAPWPSKKK